MAKEIMGADERIVRARSRMLVDWPFFAQLVMAMDIVEDNDMPMPTMCTNGERVYFDRGFVNTLSDAELNFVLIHEVMHCALGHIWRRDHRHPEVWNVAVDYAVNDIIDGIVKGVAGKQKITTEIKLHEGSLLDHRFHDMSAEEIYQHLVKDERNIQIVASGQGSQKGDDDNPGEGQEGDGDEQDGQGQGQGKRGGRRTKGKTDKRGEVERMFGKGSKIIHAPGNHDMWKDEEKKGEDHGQSMRQRWQSRLLAAADTAKRAGNMTGGLARLIDAVKRPRRSWRTLVREAIEEINNDWGWTPPDTRLGDDLGVYMPNFSEKIEVMKHVYFFVDTSGSMSNEAIAACVGEAQDCLEQFHRAVDGKFAWFDWEVFEPVIDLMEIDNDLTRVDCAGGGGTSFKNIFSWLRKNDVEAKLVIILTDGYADQVTPEEAHGYNVLWLFTTPDMDAEVGQKAYVDLDAFEHV